MQPIFIEKDDGTITLTETYDNVKGTLDGMLSEVITPSTRMPLRFIQSDVRLVREENDMDLVGSYLEIKYTIDPYVVYRADYIVGLYDDIIALKGRYIDRTNAFLVLDRQIENIIVPTTNDLDDMRGTGSYITSSLEMELKENLNIVPSVTVNLYQSQGV